MYSWYGVCSSLQNTLMFHKIGPKAIHGLEMLHGHCIMATSVYLYYAHPMDSTLLELTLHAYVRT